MVTRFLKAKITVSVILQQNLLLTPYPGRVIIF